MKKFWSTVVVLVIIPLFIFASLVCCCYNSVAEADEPTPSCHSAANTSQDHDTSQADDDCDCTYKDNLLIQKNTSAAQLTTAIISNLKDDYVSRNITSKIFQSSALTLSTQGPPKTSVCLLPIYIQNSNLQL